MNFSKEQFVEWTTKGYPLEFNSIITEEKFFSGMEEFINFNDNDFKAEKIENSVIVYDKYGEEILKAIYNGQRVLFLTIVIDDGVDKHSEAFLFQQKELGEIFLGVITFCQCMEDFFEMANDVETSKTFSSNPWPLNH